MMWIDTNGCAQSYHDFERGADGEMIASHADGSACEVTEFDLDGDVRMSLETE